MSAHSDSTVLAQIADQIERDSEMVIQLRVLTGVAPGAEDEHVLMDLAQAEFWPNLYRICAGNTNEHARRIHGAIQRATPHIANQADNNRRIAP